jgi:hypothetical protein
MESAQRHDTPPVIHLLTDRQGHGLRFELDLLQAPQCSPAGGSVHSFTDPGDAAVPLDPAPSSHQLCVDGSADLSDATLPCLMSAVMRLLCRTGR